MKPSPRLCRMSFPPPDWTTRSAEAKDNEGRPGTAPPDSKTKHRPGDASLAAALRSVTASSQTGLPEQSFIKTSKVGTAICPPWT